MNFNILSKLVFSPTFSCYALEVLEIIYNIQLVTNASVLAYSAWLLTSKLALFQSP